MLSSQFENGVEWKLLFQSFGPSVMSLLRSGSSSIFGCSSSLPLNCRMNSLLSLSVQVTVRYIRVAELQLDSLVQSTAAADLTLSLSPALNLPNVVWCFVKEFSREEEAFIRQMKGSSPLVPIIIQEQFHSEHFFSFAVCRFCRFVLFVDAPDLICVFIQVYKTVLMFSVLKNNL